MTLLEAGIVKSEPWRIRNEQKLKGDILCSFPAAYFYSWDSARGALRDSQFRIIMGYLERSGFSSLPGPFEAWFIVLR